MIVPSQHSTCEASLPFKRQKETTPTHVFTFVTLNYVYLSKSSNYILQTSTSKSLKQKNWECIGNYEINSNCNPRNRAELDAWLTEGVRE